MTIPNSIEQVINRSLINIPLRHLSEFGIDESVKYVFDKVTPQGFGNLQYAKWIMDHGNSTTAKLIEALRCIDPIPMQEAYPLSDAEHTRLVAYIGKINSTLMKHGIHPYDELEPDVWQSQKLPDLENLSAFDLLKQNQPDLTVEQFLADQPGLVGVGPEDPSPLKLGPDPEKELKVMRSMIMSSLDIFKDQADQSYDYYAHLGEARSTLMEKQFKHLRRYAKQLVRRLTAVGDKFDQVFIDTAATDQFGFLTRGIDSTEWTRHFTVKFVEDNWVIVEH